MERREGTGFGVNVVAVAIYILFGVLEALQTMTLDVQPATAGPMTAERQPTWTDDG